LLASKISCTGAEIQGFGCSDCKCDSHLFRFDKIDVSIKTCCDAFKTLELEPKMLDDLINKN
jgi:Uri superfamily endonuclease